MLARFGIFVAVWLTLDGVKPAAIRMTGRPCKPGFSSYTVLASSSVRSNF